jgi:hypothetical protein
MSEHRQFRHLIKHRDPLEIGYALCDDRRERLLTELSHIKVAKPEWNLLDWCRDAA